MRRTTPRSAFEGPILVTGASGFIGSHLVEQLKLLGPRHHIISVSRRLQKPTSTARRCDLTHTPSVKKLFSSVRPTLVFHAAGKVRGTPQELITANLLTTANILRAAEKSVSPPRIVVIGSAAEYGDPINPYIWAKRCQTSVALQKSAEGQDIVITRLFNLTGPRLPAEFVVGSIARQIVRTERKQQREVKAGELNFKRDFLDVRDAVRAIVLSARRARKGQIIEICSGRQRSGHEIVSRLRQETPRGLRIRVHAGRNSPRSTSTHSGDPGPLRRWGWKPRISFSDSLRDTLNYYRSSRD